MAKNFKTNVYDNMGAVEDTSSTEPKAEPKQAEPKKKTTPKKTTAKNPVGRPKTVTVERRKMNVAVPVELLEEWEEIKQAKNNNFTDYVTKLIEADLKENKQKYLDIIAMMNS